MSGIVTGAGIVSSAKVISAGKTGLALINAIGKPKPETASDKSSKTDSSASLAPSAKVADAPVKNASATVQLSDEAKATVERLQARDRQVRAHEQAHLAASGGLATSGASYTYQKGPDGVRYAVGGEVSIDVSPGSTPQETIARAITIRAAALAPVDPSGPDRAIAAQASQMEQQARNALASQQQGQIENQPQNKSGKGAAAYAAVSESGKVDQAEFARVNSYA